PDGSEDVTMGGSESAAGLAATNGSSVELETVLDQANPAEDRETTSHAYAEVATSQLSATTDNAPSQADRSAAIDQSKQSSSVTSRSDRTRQSEDNSTGPKDVMSRCDDPNTGDRDHGENAIHTVNQPTQPPVATGLGQQEDAMIERATSPEDEVDDIAPRRAI
ncbi:hypothetical protein ACHAPI_011939, partial [Fusarium lateritium]